MSLFSLANAGIALVVALVILEAQRFYRRRNRLPGPLGLPIVGNAFEIPATHTWIKLAELKKKYGDVSYLEVLGKPIVVLNSWKSANELLSKRAAIYSSRPRWVMAGEMMEQANGVILAPYGPHWRLMRRGFHQHLNKAATYEYESRIRNELRSFVKRLHANPDKDPSPEFHLTATRLVLDVTYGLSIDGLNDPWTVRAAEVVEALAVSVSPGSFFVDHLPWLQYIPDWVPGTGFKEWGRKWAYENDRMMGEPFREVKRRVAAGTALPSFVAKLFDKAEEIPELDDKTKQWMGGIMYAAGLDTTHVTIMNFFLYMVNFPEVQRKAQEEIDRVVGTDRIPTLDDKPNLPYVDAVFKELLRYNISTPMALPHASTEDDIHFPLSVVLDRMFIPKGSMVMPNSWAISRDPEIYPEPEKFNPERFLPEDAKAEVPLDPRLLSFGYGRRVCPGMHFAEVMVYNTMVHIFSTLNIIQPLDENGKEYTPPIAFAGGFISQALPFKCRVEERRPGAMHLVQESDM